MPWSLTEYENYVYRVTNLSPNIESSNLVLQHRGRTACRLTGTIYFKKNIRLEILERLNFLDDEEEFINDYGYIVWQNDERLYWYDSHGHPTDPSLQTNHPHHKHIPPDIKHHRIPAPDVSFNNPNLTFLIHEIDKQFFG